MLEVEWIRIDEEPEAERIWVGVALRENMSVGCARASLVAGRFSACHHDLTIVDGVGGEILLRLGNISLTPKFAELTALHL